MSTPPSLALTASPDHLKFLLSLTAENLIRLESILERRQLLGPSPEFDAIIAAMLDWCKQYRETYLRQAPVITRILSDQITPIEDIAIRTLLRNCIATFLVLHELLLFLPRESVRKELYFFCKQLFHPHYDPADLSVILTSAYNAYEYSLDDAMRSIDVFISKVPDPKRLNFGHVMELAIIDRDNPLSWALLAHEFGHYLDSKHQVSIPLADQFVEISFKPPTPEERKTWQGIFRPLASELFADLTCYYLLGPVSILPIVNMELNFGMATDTPIPFDHVHPLTSTRLQVISETAAAEEMSLDVFSSYVRALEEDENEKAAKLSSVQQKERATIKEYTKFFAVRLRAELLERIADLGLKKFDATALGTAVQLTKALEQGIPVGSKRRHADSEIRSVLASLTSTSAVEQSQAAFNMFKEVPVTVPEVLSAGWIAKSNQRVDWLKKGFAEKAVDRIFPTMKSALEHQDRLLIKSIETVAVVGGVTDVA